MSSTTRNDSNPMPGHFIQNIDTAPAYWWLDNLWVILAQGNDTGGRYSLMYQKMDKDAGAPPHKHTWSDEHFYLLEGDVTFLIGDEVRTGHQGDFVFVPRDTRHAFRIDSETATFINGFSPAGLEMAIIDHGMPAPERVIPPKGATPAPSMTPDQYRRYGMENLPGPNPLRVNGH